MLKIFFVCVERFSLRCQLYSGLILLHLHVEQSSFCFQLCERRKYTCLVQPCNFFACVVTLSKQIIKLAFSKSKQFKQDMIFFFKTGALKKETFRLTKKTTHVSGAIFLLAKTLIIQVASPDTPTLSETPQNYG